MLVVVVAVIVIVITTTTIFIIIYTNFAVNWLAFLLRIYMYACQFKGTHKV
jgi:hypothetical protein